MTTENPPPTPFSEPSLPESEIQEQIAYQKEYRTILFHSITSFVGQSAMQVVDLLFCRNLGSNASATVGVAASFIAWFMVVGLGLVSSLEYFIPHSIGAKDERKAHSYFYTGIVVSLLVSFLGMIALVLLAHFAGAMGVHPSIRESVQSFCYITAPSYFTIFMVPVLRVELQARGNPHASSFAFLFANLLNILLNWAFVLGHLGFEPHGIVGSAWANVVSRLALLLFFLLRAWKLRSHLGKAVDWWRVEYRVFGEKILRMGLPTSLHLMFEMGAFIFVGMLAARLSPVQSAAHSIALSVASLSFMIPLGMGSAASVTMSKAMGENNPKLARQFATTTIRLGLLYAGFGSLMMILFRKQLMGFYTIDEGTIETGKTILIIAAAFQFGDAMQVILAGILRGAGETKIQAKMNAFGHWILGVPIGIFLGFKLNWGVAGLWIGLSVGLFAVAIGLGYRWKTRAIL